MIKKIFKIIKKRRYKAITIIAAVLSFAIFYFLTVMNVYKRSIIVYSQINGTLFTITSLILSLILSLFIGVYLSLVIHKIDAKFLGKKPSIMAIGSVGAGTAVTGCPSCGIPLLALFGFPLALMSLPFKGLEIKLLSVIIMSLSIYLIARKLHP